MRSACTSNSEVNFHNTKYGFKEVTGLICCCAVCHCYDREREGKRDRQRKLELGWGWGREREKNRERERFYLQKSNPYSHPSDRYKIGLQPFFTCWYAPCCVDLNVAVIILQNKNKSPLNKMEKEYLSYVHVFLHTLPLSWSK